MSAQEKSENNPVMQAFSGADKSPAEVAGYIADMVLELRNMAKDSRLEFLAYLLEMSFQEAFDISQKKGEK